MDIFLRTFISQIKKKLLWESTSYEIWSKSNVFHKIKVFQMFTHFILIYIAVRLKNLFPMLKRITILNKIFINQCIVWLSWLPSMIKIFVFFFRDFCSLRFFVLKWEIVMLKVHMTFIHLCENFAMIYISQVVQMRNLSIES